MLPKLIYRSRCLYLVSLAGFIILCLACCNQAAPGVVRNQQPGRNTPDIAQLTSPEQGSIFTWGDEVPIEVSYTIPEAEIDSVSLSLGNDISETLYDEFSSLSLKTDGNRVGQVTVRFTVYYRDSLTESHALNLVLLSNVVPENYSYELINAYPHDNEAYTQGLLYHNGYLYESTGLEGKSTLRIVEIASGEPIKTVHVNNDIFAEGITAYGDRIYQVTYRSQIGFIYDINSLEQVRRFDYQVDEGWGLTTDGINLVMSDGSSFIYLFEPEFFTQVGQFSVFDSRGMVDNLNELEYVNGKILANIYGETYIVVIDATTGKVTGRLDLDNLMPEGARNDMARVLNGIAYDPATGHLYVTGKNWPVLYEISVRPAL